MKYSQYHIIIVIVIIALSNSCRTRPLLLDNPILEDSLFVYLDGIKDMENWRSNPMTTFINVYDRNDSIIVSFDSQPEISRITIPGYNAGYGKFIKLIDGFYNEKLVYIWSEDKYLKNINLNKNKLRKLSKKEKDALKECPVVNEFGWGDDKYYREYYINGKDSVKLLKSLNPILTPTIPESYFKDRQTGLDVYECTSVFVPPRCNGEYFVSGFDKELSDLLLNEKPENDSAYFFAEVQFVIDKNGNLVGSRIRNKTSNMLNENERLLLEAIDMIQDWQPGLVKGRPVNVLMTIMVSL